jgi:hypothetical protein
LLRAYVLRKLVDPTTYGTFDRFADAPTALGFCVVCGIRPWLPLPGTPLVLTVDHRPVRLCDVSDSVYRFVDSRGIETVLPAIDPESLNVLPVPFDPPPLDRIPSVNQSFLARLAADCSFSSNAARAFQAAAIAELCPDVPVSLDLHFCRPKPASLSFFAESPGVWRCSKAVDSICVDFDHPGSNVPLGFASKTQLISDSHTFRMPDGFACPIQMTLIGPTRELLIQTPDAVLLTGMSFACDVSPMPFVCCVGAPRLAEPIPLPTLFGKSDSKTFSHVFSSGRFVPLSELHRLSQTGDAILLPPIAVDQLYLEIGGLAPGALEILPGVSLTDGLCRWEIPRPPDIVGLFIQKGRLAFLVLAGRVAPESVFRLPDSMDSFTVHFQFQGGRVSLNLGERPFKFSVDLPEIPAEVATWFPTTQIAGANPPVQIELFVFPPDAFNSELPVPESRAQDSSEVIDDAFRCSLARFNVLRTRTEALDRLRNNIKNARNRIFETAFASARLKTCTDLDELVELASAASDNPRALRGEICADLAAKFEALEPAQLKQLSARALSILRQPIEPRLVFGNWASLFDFGGCDAVWISPDRFSDPIRIFFGHGSVRFLKERNPQITVPLPFFRVECDSVFALSVIPLTFSEGFGFALNFVNFLLKSRPELAVRAFLHPLFLDVNTGARTLFTGTCAIWFDAARHSQALTPDLAQLFANAIDATALQRIADPRLSESLTRFCYHCCGLGASDRVRESRQIEFLDAVNNDTTTAISYSLLFPDRPRQRPTLTAFAFRAAEQFSGSPSASVVDALAVLKMASANIDAADLVRDLRGSQPLPPPARFRKIAVTLALDSPVFARGFGHFAPDIDRIVLPVAFCGSVATTAEFFHAFDALYSVLPSRVTSAPIVSAALPKLAEDLFVNYGAAFWPSKYARDAAHLTAFAGFGKFLAWAIESAVECPIRVSRALVRYVCGGEVRPDDFESGDAQLIQELRLQLDAIRSGVAATGAQLSADQDAFPRMVLRGTERAASNAPRRALSLSHCQTDINIGARP